MAGMGGARRARVREDCRLLAKIRTTEIKLKGRLFLVTSPLFYLRWNWSCHVFCCRTMAAAEADKFFSYDPPKPGVKYPQEVIYIEDCDGWPLEYCEYHPNYAKAKEWMEKNLADDMKALYLGEQVAGAAAVSGAGEGAEADDGDDGDKKKRRQTRGGKGVIKTKKKQTEPQRIGLSRASRGKKKYVTVVTGLATYEIDLKVASKAFGSKFACGSSVTGDDEIVIQGDVKDDLFDFIPEKWPTIDEDNIDDLGDQKR